MSEPGRDPSPHDGGADTASSHPGAAQKPSEAQRRYLSRGIRQPGGKLPLFDEDGRRIDKKTVETCIERGWAEPWFANPMRTGWMVCKLTEAGFNAIGKKS